MVFFGCIVCCHFVDYSTIITMIQRTSDYSGGDMDILLRINADITLFKHFESESQGGFNEVLNETSGRLPMGLYPSGRLKKPLERRAKFERRSYAGKNHAENGIAFNICCRGEENQLNYHHAGRKQPGEQQQKAKAKIQTPSVGKTDDRNSFSLAKIVLAIQDSEMSILMEYIRFIKSTASFVKYC